MLALARIFDFYDESVVVVAHKTKDKYFNSTKGYSSTPENLLKGVYDEALGECVTEQRVRLWCRATRTRSPGFSLIG